MLDEYTIKLLIANARVSACVRRVFSAPQTLANLPSGKIEPHTTMKKRKKKKGTNYKRTICPTIIITMEGSLHEKTLNTARAGWHYSRGDVFPSSL